jgi:hypothetical protein
MKQAKKKARPFVAVANSKKLAPTQRRRVSAATSKTLKNLLRFKVTYDIFLQLVHDAQTHWREFEERMHWNYPVKATGVKTIKETMSSMQSEYLLDEQDLSPEYFHALLAEFPLESAAASYVFSILEMHGDALLRVANRKYLNEMPRTASWHYLVYGDANIKKADSLIELTGRYGKPFHQAPMSVEICSVQRLVLLKRARNAFIHELETDIDFNRYFAFAVGVVCDLEFMLVPNSRVIKEFPFEDYYASWGRLGPPYRPMSDGWCGGERRQEEQGNYTSIVEHNAAARSARLSGVEPR